MIFVLFLAQVYPRDAEAATMLQPYTTTPSTGVAVFWLTRKVVDMLLWA